MPTNFPTSVDNFTNPTANDSLNLPSHSTQHANSNDAIEAIEGYLLNGGQGLTLVKKQTIGSGVSSVSVSSAFSATYENYKIIISGGAASLNNLPISLVIGNATANYYFLLRYDGYSGAANYATVKGGNTSVWNYVGNGGTSGLSLMADVQSPFLTKVTSFNSSYYSADNAGTNGGYLGNTTSYTSFGISIGGGTMTGGTIYVYGYGI